ncbi:protein SNOWY COTYLEDON 3-like isoform X2 [Rhodamnia argentea]|uniref:Protein SNOWY COTYLEDON 3-like isoform X2 n=1 Tax=Rhodamnia argentea TaxID=178133 RepID=A0A8B8R4S8_9MYRT|nr:protein SNOWY COTYLEDON 3-like isoform X2 [Rhodamnia argentea]
MAVVAAISDPPNPSNLSDNPPLPSSSSSSSSTRAPAKPSLSRGDRDSGNGSLNSRRPKSRQVSSRYLSPSPSASTAATAAGSTPAAASSSRRFASPVLSRSSNSTPSASPLPKRSQSVDRRRPTTPTPRPIPRPSSPARQGNAGEVSAAAKILISSKRSLSVSFQGEAFSVPVNKAKEVSARKATPERRRATSVRDSDGDQVENSRPGDQHRWPARIRQGNLVSSANSLTRSLDCSSGAEVRKKLSGFGSGDVLKAMQQSMIVESRRTSFDGRLSLDMGNADRMFPRTSDGNSAGHRSAFHCDGTSDTDSVSSGDASGLHECGVGGIAKLKNVPSGIVVSARFWQETNSRLRRLQDPGSPLSSSGSRIASSDKFVQSKRFSADSSISTSRTMASPIRGATRPASPSKVWTSSSPSPSKGMSSPSRVRPVSGSLTSSSNFSSSILSFSVDVRKGKMGEDRVVDAHMLRLLYNRYLQWRLVNARVDANSVVQRRNAEKIIWNSWVTISELQHSVTLKRMKLLLLRQKLKLTSILKGQISYLEEWSLLDRDHASSLLGATEALRASTLRLPVIGKAIQADVQKLKDAMGSAVDVMQAMASSICSLSLKVEEMNFLLAELVNVTAKEQLSMVQCKDYLSKLTAMQVKDCSLRTHILQKNHLLTP